MKRVLCVPFAPTLGDARRNRARLGDLAQAIAESGASPDLVVLPELALSGYLLESLVAEVALDRDQLASLAESLTTTGLAARTEWVLGIPLRENGQIYNAAVVLSGGQVQHIQKKFFLPTYGMFDEARYFSRGDALEAYTGTLGKSVILICEDAWHLELAYAAAETRAENVIVISASPARGYAEGLTDFDSTRTWHNRLKIFSESYGQNFIYCNRSGVEDGILFDGNTFVIDANARGIPGRAASFYEGAKLFEIATASERHAGFAGNSSRQNDLPLVRDLFSRL